MHDNVLHIAQGDYLQTYIPSAVCDNVLHTAQGDYLHTYILSGMHDKINILGYCSLQTVNFTMIMTTYLLHRNSTQLIY